jgi:hypothetical protein
VTSQMIVNIILTLSLPISIWIGYWIAQYQIQRMPLHQRLVLEQFSKLAVRYTEYAHQGSIDKKALAIAFTSDLFEEFKLPIPSSETLEIAVGAAIFEVTAQPKKIPGGS